MGGHQRKSAGTEALHIQLTTNHPPTHPTTHTNNRSGPAFDAALASPEASGCQNTSTSWVLLSSGPGQEGTVLCSADLLAERLEAGVPAATEEEGQEDRRVLGFDHVYPANVTVAEPPRVVAMLYSTIGTTEFAGFHALLKPRAQAGELRCVPCADGSGRGV